MTSFTKQAQIHSNLYKLSCAAGYIRRKRAKQKQAAYKQALSTAQKEDLTAAGIGAGAGGLLGGALGYGFGGKNRLLSTLIGAGAGAGIGGGAGYGLNRYYLNPVLKLEDKALANDLRNLRGQGIDAIRSFGDRLNDTKLEGDDLYAVNKAFNRALGHAVRKERKADNNFVLSDALYRPEMENDRTVAAYGVGSNQRPTGDVRGYGSGFWHGSTWDAFTPDRVESELAAMQRAEDAGNLPKGSTQEAAQNYYDAMAHVDSAYQVMGGSEGIRLAGVDSAGNPMFNVPTKVLDKGKLFGDLHDTVNVTYNPEDGMFHRDRSGLRDFGHTAGSIAGGVGGTALTVAGPGKVGKIFSPISKFLRFGGNGSKVLSATSTRFAPRVALPGPTKPLLLTGPTARAGWGSRLGTGIKGLVGWTGGSYAGGWLGGGSDEVKDFDQMLSNPDLAPQGGVSYSPILNRIKKTYRLQ